MFPVYAATLRLQGSDPVALEDTARAYANALLGLGSDTPCANNLLDLDVRTMDGATLRTKAENVGHSGPSKTSELNTKRAHLDELLTGVPAEHERLSPYIDDVNGGVVGSSRTRWRCWTR